MTNHPARSKPTDWPEYIRAFRKHHNITQQQLAEYLSLPDQSLAKRTVENWEEDINEPPPYLKHALKWLAKRIKSSPLI